MFGKRLKKLREELGLTQEELGKKLNLVKSNVSMYENGTRIPNAETLEQLSQLFDASIDYLLGKSEVKNIAKPYNDELEKTLYNKTKELNTEEKKAILNIINLFGKNESWFKKI